MFWKIEQLQYNQSRSEPKLHIKVSRSRSEPKSSISKISGADRSRRSSKGLDRSGSKFEPIVHLCRAPATSWWVGLSSLVWMGGEEDPVL